MTAVRRVLPAEPLTRLDDYVEQGGGAALGDARRVDPETIISELEASGLRGRGGAGFPTGVKWRTVAQNRAAALPTTVVVNAAEGEPGTFKDRAIIRANPYHVLEGALIAARAVGADLVVVALKRSFTPEVQRMRAAVREVEAAGWTDGVRIEVFEGPDEYLYGEETALLEVLDGRQPFPRIAPPFRRGVDEVVVTPADLTSESGLANRVEMAGPMHSDAPPALVDNVETLANVPAIVTNGAAWFRAVGTERSPGTIVCTVSGSTVPGVGEYAMGTPIREVIDDLGQLRPRRRVKAVLPGVSSGVLLPEHLDTPLTYEDMEAAGSGLGSAGFIVVDDSVDAVSFAAGASRFLAVESCGQCTPCKQDGLAIAELLERLCDSDATPDDYAELLDRIGTVADGARCSLGRQHEAVIGSIVRCFDPELRVHIDHGAKPVDSMLVAELLSVDGDVAVWDEHHREKQPDWTFDDTYSGQAPADRFGDHRAGDQGSA